VSELSRRELFRMVMPLRRGKHTLAVDGKTCSGCGLCVSACEADALVMRQEEDSLQISFIPAECNSCGDCVNICPERSLVLKPVEKDAAEKVLLEKEMMRCSSCGQIIGTNVIIEKTGIKAGERLLCPGCAIRREMAGI
jgi:ferredoxin